MTFDEFMKEFWEQYETTDTDYDGSVLYYFNHDGERHNIGVNLLELTELMTDEQLEDMLNRAEIHDEEKVKDIYAIIEQDVGVRTKVEELDDRGLLRHVFDDTALDVAESTESFREIVRELYELAI